MYFCPTDCQDGRHSKKSEESEWTTSKQGFVPSGDGRWLGVFINSSGSVYFSWFLTTNRGSATFQSVSKYAAVVRLDLTSALLLPCLPCQGSSLPLSLSLPSYQVASLLNRSDLRLKLFSFMGKNWIKEFDVAETV